LETQDVRVCGKDFLEEHVLSLGGLQAVTGGEKLATLEVGFRRCNSHSYDRSPLTDKALSQELENDGINAEIYPSNAVHTGWKRKNFK
jgi:hypothetical protein